MRPASALYLIVETVEVGQAGGVGLDANRAAADFGNRAIERVLSATGYVYLAPFGSEDLWRSRDRCRSSRR
jgi:hypothetical protein